MSPRSKPVRHALIAAVLGVIVGTGLSYVVDADAGPEAPLSPPGTIRPTAAPSLPTTLIGDNAAVAAWG